MNKIYKKNLIKNVFVSENRLGLRGILALQQTEEFNTLRNHFSTEFIK